MAKVVIGGHGIFCEIAVCDSQDIDIFGGHFTFSDDKCGDECECGSR